MSTVDAIPSVRTSPDALEADLAALFASSPSAPVLDRLDRRVERDMGVWRPRARRRSSLRPGRRAAFTVLVAATFALGGATGSLQGLYQFLAGPFDTPWHRGQDIGLSQTVDGYTVTIDRAYADATRLALAISVVDDRRRPNTTQVEAFSAVVTDASGEYLRPPAGYTRAVMTMDDERWEPGMPELDRQAIREPAAPTARSPRTTTDLPPSIQRLPQRSVPEVAPTPLQRHYINLSVIVLICGAIAITALNLGARLGDPLIKLCVIVAAPLLVVTTADAIVRIWRSAWAWMGVDRGKGLFRLAWVATSLVGLAALIAASIAVLLA